MKKLATLLLAAGMVVSASAPASAADIKVGGFHQFTFETGNTGFTGANDEEALQRTRLNLTIAASENLTGFIEFQMGTDTWGDYVGKTGNGYGNNVKHGRYNVQTRQAYVDWTVPGTAVKVRMGRSCFGLPADAFGNNAVMDAGWGGRDGVIVTAPVADWLNVTATWSRAFSDGADVDTSNNADIFALAAALKFNGFAVTPYAAYASIDDGCSGKGVDGVGDKEVGFDKLVKATDGSISDKTAWADANAYWFGATATLSYFDPFTLKVSAAYGKKEFEQDAFEDRDGWNVQAKASYKLGFGTPVLGAWYGSGDDADVKYARQNWMPSINGRFLASQDFHDGAWGLGGGAATNNICGTWGVQAGIEDMSFLADLTHSFKITWIQGTNNTALIEKGVAALEAAGASFGDLGFYSGPQSYMTTSDSVIEFALSNTYKIYKNFAANLELAYIINNFDEDLYETAAGKNFDEDDWRVSLGFKYTF
ncbi:MAG: outer membrane homotrimeric porin [Mailhella sp.]|nr:outer membrane homotrimeric porin [Mailhella sp.]